MGFYSDLSPNATIVPGQGSWQVDPPSRVRVINSAERSSPEPVPPTPLLTREQIATRLSKPVQDVTDREREDEMFRWILEEVSR